MSTSGEAFEVDHLGEVASTRAPQYVRFNFPAFMPLRSTKSSASWKQFNPIWASPWTQEKPIFDTKEISKLVFRLTQLRQAKLKPCQISIRSVLTPLEIADAGQLVEMSLKLCSRGCRNGEWARDGKSFFLWDRACWWSQVRPKLRLVDFVLLRSREQERLMSILHSLF